MTRPDSYIVGIGCSSGCLSVLRTFFLNVPVNTGMSFVVVQHLSREYRSILDQLLLNYTDLPIVRLTMDTKIAPDHIYLLTEDNYVKISGNTLKILTRKPEDIINRAVDVFFKSLAVNNKDKAIGIILSGMGTDGLEGAKAIKRENGIVYVQDPQSTDYKGMPNAIIEGDHPVEILPPAELAQTLVDFYRV